MSLLNNYVERLEKRLKCDFYDGSNRIGLIARLINTKPGIDMDQIINHDTKTDMVISVSRNVFQIVVSSPPMRVYHFSIGKSGGHFSIGKSGVPSVSLLFGGTLVTRPLTSELAKVLIHIYHIMFIGVYMNAELSHLYGQNITFDDEFTKELKSYFSEHFK